MTFLALTPPNRVNPHPLQLLGVYARNIKDKDKVRK